MISSYSEKRGKELAMAKKMKPVCIVGPTATGKTWLSLALAKRIPSLEIIYADSMAIYRYLDVGTDKPSPEERGTIPHHLVDFLDPRERWSAFQFKREAQKLTRAIFDRGNFPLIVGGTAFYLNTFLTSFAPAGVPADWRIRKTLEQLANEQLFSLLKEIDPRRAIKVGKQDRKRLVRALEIFYKTGLPPSFFQPQKGRVNSEPSLLIGIRFDKEELQAKIKKRIDRMFEQGIVEEVRLLLDRGYAESDPGLNNFTYRPVVKLIKGQSTLEETKTAIFQGTMSLVKRQNNWFKKAPIYWLESNQNREELVDQTINLIRKKGGWKK